MSVFLSNLPNNRISSDRTPLSANQNKIITNIKLGVINQTNINQMYPVDANLVTCTA